MFLPIKILIADDNPYMRECLKTLISYDDTLQLEGIAKNGNDAILLAGALKPDIILMDVNMKPVSGFEATKKILSLYPTIKIIGLSLHTQNAYCKCMLQVGARGYITKSAAVDEILLCIREVASGIIHVNQKKMLGGVPLIPDPY